MEYINIMEAARRCQVSDKTIRRAIHSGKLAAKYLKHNQCEIAVSDLEAWHELSQDATERRLADLETRITECRAEQLALMKRTIAFHDNFTVLQETEKYNTVQQLHKMMEAMKMQDQYIAALEQRIAALEAKQPVQPRGKAQKRRDLVSLDRFIASHSLTHLDFQRAVNAGVLRPPEDVKQKDGTIIQCLDSEGRRAFYEALHHSVPTWMDCPICPHELV